MQDFLYKRHGRKFKLRKIYQCHYELQAAPKEKNTEDYLEIEPESEQPYNIWDLFADFMLGWAHNPKVDRYIPLEEIRAALKNGICGWCV